VPSERSGSREFDLRLSKETGRVIRRIPRVPFLAPVVAVAFALNVACGGGGGSSNGSHPASSEATSTVSPAAATTTAAASATGAQKSTGVPPADAAVIDQKDVSFRPDHVTINLGDSVYFTDNEAVVHSVNVDTKNLLGPGGLMKQGEVLSWKPPKAGDYIITCDFHPAMRAIVTVQ
jgi:plastocyanin